MYTGSVASGFNSFVPSFEASGKLIINYSRNAKDFALNRYLSIVKVPKSQFYYSVITPDSAGRIGRTNLADFSWPDGAYAPTGVWNNAVFNFQPGTTKRYTYPFLLGALAVEQADWPILAVQAGQMAQLAMTARTLLTASVIFTSANYDSNHTSSVGSLITNNFPNMSTGNWAQGTDTNPIIMASLMYGAQQIQKTTLSAVRTEDMILLVSPAVATKMAVSAEIHAYMKSSPFAAAAVRGDVPWLNKVWGLPDTLYGFTVVVDGTSYVSSELGASSTTYSYVLDAISGTSAALISRPGGLEGTYGTSSFSTVTGFFMEEMSVESMYDSVNRLHTGRVTENYGIIMTAPAAAYLFTSCVS